MLGAFIGRIVATVVALVVATALLPGIALETNDLATEIPAIVVVSAIFGVANSLVKPLIRFRHTPVYMIVLAAVLLVLNAGLLLLTSWVCSLLGVPWRVDGLGSAVLGGLIVSVVSFLATSLFGSRGVDHR